MRGRITSDAILDEVGRVLRYPRIARRHRRSEEQIGALLDDLADVGIPTPGGMQLSVIQRDLSDNRYLECAVEGGARFLVSGDRDILDLGGYSGIEIVTPVRFLELLENA